MAKLKLNTVNILDISRAVEDLLIEKGVTPSLEPELAFRVDRATLNKINEDIYYATHPKTKEEVELEPCDEVRLKVSNGLLTFKVLPKAEEKAPVG